LQSRVTDLTGTLTSDQSQQLEATLRQFEFGKGSQVVVLVVPTTGDESIEQYGIRVADRWKIGRSGVSDGVILLIAKNDRTVRIEVGRGLEGAIPDATASQIINENIVPFLKQGDFGGGIEAGVGQIIKVIQGEPLPDPDSNQSRFKLRIETIYPFMFLGVPMITIFLSSLIGALMSGLIAGCLMGSATYVISGKWAESIAFGVFFFLFTAIASAIGRLPRTGSKGGGGPRWGSRSGGWSSGGGGGGWSGGGGFSGGGGSFSGGGASGRW
jgi:uncharacterized protein